MNICKKFKLNKRDSNTKVNSTKISKSRWKTWHASIPSSLRQLHYTCKQKMPKTKAWKDSQTVLNQIELICKYKKLNDE